MRAAYQSEAISKRRRKQIYDIDYRIQPIHQFLIAVAKFLERLHLYSKYIRNRLGTATGVELRSKGMGVETLSGHPQVLL